MANRPVFVPNLKGKCLVAPIAIEFPWFPGLSLTQKQKSIRSLHAAVEKQRGLCKLLEISSKSETPLGVALSAFNLQFRTGGGILASVEKIFQASKVFERGGPYIDLLEGKSVSAKKDTRLRQSGALVRFELEGRNWLLQPKTAFYDWLYLNALMQHPEMAEQLMDYDGFTDIEFNPERSLNCQAASAALYVSLVKRGQLGAALQSEEDFLSAIGGSTP